MNKVRFHRLWRGSLLAGSLFAFASLGGEGESAPGDAVWFTNISLDPTSGIAYRRGPSPLLQGVYDAATVKPFMSLAELFATPLRTRGSPGVAILDYDNDGDEDIFVTNGPGRPNSLYQNQLRQTGHTRFVDVGATAGVGAIDMDATGTCYGDIDNDGDVDLMVLGRMEPNRLFRNNGNGTFTQLTEAGIGGGAKGHSGCTMGDINGDGLLDIYVGNSFDWYNREAIYSDLFAYNHANDLYVNQGNNVFAEVSQSAGLQTLHNAPRGSGTITWAQAIVDYDMDGDVDILHGDDNGGLPPSGFAGVDRGFIQQFRNDGTGNFANVTAQSGAASRSTAWMGIAFGDLNCDGNMDIFATSTGDYFFPMFGIATPPGLDSTRWMLGLGDGSGGFSEPDLTGLGVTNFGWGTGIADYDNDGDADIIYYGGLDTVPLQSADNPGTILKNNGCSAQFTWDREATAATAERTLRQDVMGVALGDLNDDGFADIVTTSGQYVPPKIPLVKAPSLWGAPFDSTAYYLPNYTWIGPFEWEWSGVELEDGFLDVKLNSGNTNKWVKIRVKGSKGLTPLGKVNRDGIGAIVKFTPAGGMPSMSPVLGGSSHLSQHSLVQGFGLGSATRGTVDIFWPGGVKNRLYDVLHAERLTIPEVPCDYAATWPSRNAFRNCVVGATNDLMMKGVINNTMRQRLQASALKAYDESH